MAEARRHPIIEFVGVPGVGKSTIARSVRNLLPPTLGPQVPPASRRGSPRLYGAAAGLLLSLRPLASNDVHRCFKIIEAHNVYRHGLAAPLLLEQGLIQRLWSAVADRRGYGAAQLEAFTRILAEAAPDVIVHVRTAPATAAARILSRPTGNSRYERMAEAEIIARMAPAAAIYDTLLGLFRQHSAAAILEISGEDPVADNTARIAAFLRGALPALMGQGA